MNRKLLFISSLILLLLGWQSVKAQTCSDIVINTTTTTATCATNGEIAVEVVNNYTAATAEYFEFDIRQVTGTTETSVTGGWQTTNVGDIRKFTKNGLEGGKEYKVYVKVKYSTALEVMCSKIETIPTTYKTPVLNVTSPRASLKKNPSGLIRIYVQDGAGPYTATITNTVTNQVQTITGIASNTEKLVEVYGGTYTVAVKSEPCNTQFEQNTVEVKTVVNELPWAPSFLGANAQSAFLSNPICGSFEVSLSWVTLSLSSYNVKPELYPYITTPSLYSKYYEYGVKKEGATTWYPITSTTNYIRLGRVLTGYTYKEMTSDPTKKPQIYFRVKNADGTYTYTSNYFTGAESDTPAAQGMNIPLTDLVNSIIDEQLVDCAKNLFSIRARITNSNPTGYCFPVSYTLKDNITGTVITQVDSHNSNNITIDNIPTGSTYTLTVTTADGYVANTNVAPKVNASTFVDVIRGCTELKYADIVGYSYIHIHNHIGAFSNKEVTLISAPAGYIPEAGMMAVGETRLYPASYLGNIIYPFSPFSSTGETYMYRNAAYGTYHFQIKDNCTGATAIIAASALYTLENRRITFDEASYKPVIDNSQCGYVYIYPFKNSTNLLKQNGSYIPAYAVVRGLATGIVAEYSNESNMLNSATDGANAWIRIPNTVQTANLVVSGSSYVYTLPPTGTSSTSFATCTYTQSLNLQAHALQYDRATYYGYRCPTGANGKVYLKAINAAGPFKYELYKEDGTTLLATRTAVAAGVAVTFTEADFGTPVSLKYKVKITSEACQNFVMEDIQLFDLNDPGVILTQDNVRRYCVNEPFWVSVIALSENDSDYKWTFPDGSVHTGRIQQISSATSLHSGKYTVTVSNINCTTPTFSTSFDINIGSKVMRWRADAPNANWHDPGNWLLEDNKTAANAVPTRCSTVHLPGKLSAGGFYPDLSGTNTPRELYGNPSCSEIYFHQGSQLGMPHLLVYDRAFVRYNWGYYDTGGTFTQLPEAEEGTALQRNRWYMLAAPIKKMASGDFGMAGYPKTYQRLYNATNPQTKILTSGDFTSSFNTLGYELSGNQNALAVKVGGNNTTIGFNNHRHLNNLQGIMEMPFYQNPVRLQHYPLHEYAAGSSRFRYYVENTLQPLGKFDAIARGSEGYRFVYENAGSNQIGTAVVDGVTVQCYSLSTTGRTGEIMVGNPFMTTIDFAKFYQANSTRIEDYYRIFENNTWKDYKVGVNSAQELLIAPLQAFVIKLKGTQPLLFPVSGTLNVLNPEGKPALRSSADTDKSENNLPVLNVKLSNAHGDGTGTVVWNAGNSGSVHKVVHPDYDEQPQVYFEGTDGMFNSIQVENTPRVIIPLGIYSSETGRMELAFTGMDKDKYSELLLVDRETGYRQDLRINPTHVFTHSTPYENGRFIIRAKLRGVEYPAHPEREEDTTGISVNYTKSGLLQVLSQEAMESVILADVQGRTVFTQGRIGLRSYERFVSLQPGVYIVRVKTDKGTIKREKLLVNSAR